MRMCAFPLRFTIRAYDKRRFEVNDVRCTCDFCVSVACKANEAELLLSIDASLIDYDSSAYLLTSVGSFYFLSHTYCRNVHVRMPQPHEIYREINTRIIPLYFCGVFGNIRIDEWDTAHKWNRNDELRIKRSSTASHKSNDELRRTVRAPPKYYYYHAQRHRHGQCNVCVRIAFDANIKPICRQQRTRQMLFICTRIQKSRQWHGRREGTRP